LRVSVVCVVVTVFASVCYLTVVVEMCLSWFFVCRCCVACVRVAFGCVSNLVLFVLLFFYFYFVINNYNFLIFVSKIYTSLLVSIQFDFCLELNLVSCVTELCGGDISRFNGPNNLFGMFNRFFAVVAFYCICLSRW